MNEEDYNLAAGEFFKKIEAANEFTSRMKAEFEHFDYSDILNTILNLELSPEERLFFSLRRSGKI